jgi:4-diphosphocytidyl-2-C-methyl-D-erythritol kinase
MAGIVGHAPAKINLALHVTGRRADGFHELDTLAVFADIGDRVEIEEADELSLSVTGPFAAHAPGDSTDLAWRAAVAFFEHAGRKPAAAIRVEKNIPAGAGLGGGSADAAAVLRVLNYSWRPELGPVEFAALGQKLGDDELAAIAQKLGADVSMCLHRFALRARGIGERIERIHGWPPLPILLVWPGQTVSTAAVFSALHRRENPPLSDSHVAWGPAEMADLLASYRNDLEEPALAIAPEIGEVLTALRATENCLLARMSGSGSACFGLYATEEAAGKAAAELKARRTGWWVTATRAN